MTLRRRDGTRSAIVALGLALGGGWQAQAQLPNLSTGSGVGTGAGAGAMSSANTGAGGAMSSANTGAGGAMSARGAGSLLGRMGGEGSVLPLGPRQGGFTPFGPGVDVSFPNDPYLVPYLLPVEAANRVPGQAPSQITSDLLKNARSIADPAERSLALRQIAKGAIANTEMVLAHQILEESITATSEATVPLVRDQRLIGLVVALNQLSDALLRVGREREGLLASREEAQVAGVDPSLQMPESRVLIRMARLEWRRAVYLADLISNPTYRNEMLYDIAEAEAVGSSTIANDFPAPMAVDSLGNRPGQGAPPPPQAVPPPPQAVPPRPTREGQPGPAQPPSPLGTRSPANMAREAADVPLPESATRKKDVDFAAVADEVLVDSWTVATKIDRLIWRNRAMVRIALSASDSRQFSRGVELSKTIDNAESRCEALLLLAEQMCRPEHSHPAAATAAYQATAEAVASIPQAGLRGVMTGFLVDSLIASGRFDDARACTSIYPEESERFVALGSIAESQGRRGLADSARQWIATEAPEAYRSALYRRVSMGVMYAIENQRSKDQGTGFEAPPPAR